MTYVEAVQQWADACAIEEAESGNPARGIMIGLALCLPFWAAVAWLLFA